MSKMIMKCPVCNSEIQYTQWSEYGIGPVEFHIYCDNCGYFADMCYGPVYAGICEGYDPIYEDKVKELQLPVVPPELVP